jgi:hypothetical protein
MKMVLKWLKHSRKAGHFDSNSEQADAAAHALCVTRAPASYASLTESVPRRAYLDY